MPNLLQIADQLRAELAANERIAAACLFGSVQRQQTWEHSDIDLFVVTHEAMPRHEGVYLRRNQVLIHLQVLSLLSLRQKAASSNGGPFFAALASGEVWFDKTGNLSAAVESAHHFVAPFTRWRACLEFTAAVDHLHRVEKNLVHGSKSDAFESMIKGLHAMAAASLAERGIYPARDLWEHPLVKNSVEGNLLAKLLGGTAPDLIMSEVWDRIRAGLATFASPILDRVKTMGVATIQQLMNDPYLQGMMISERLIAEMVNLGLLVEIEVHDPTFGWDALAYQSHAAS